eukprot:9504102-Pyramimonas_sp.AAC.3
MGKECGVGMPKCPGCGSPVPSAAPPGARRGSRAWLSPPPRASRQPRPCCPRPFLVLLLQLSRELNGAGSLAAYRWRSRQRILRPRQRRLRPAGMADPAAMTGAVAPAVVAPQADHVRLCAASYSRT